MSEIEELKDKSSERNPLDEIILDDGGRFVETHEVPIIKQFSYRPESRETRAVPSIISADFGTPMIRVGTKGFDPEINNKTVFAADFDPQVVCDVTTTGKIFKKTVVTVPSFDVYYVTKEHINPVVRKDIHANLSVDNGVEIRPINLDLQISFLPDDLSPEDVYMLMGRFQNRYKEEKVNEYRVLNVTNEMMIDPIINNIITSFRRSVFTVATVFEFYNTLVDTFKKLLIDDQDVKNLKIDIQNVVVSCPLTSLEQIRSYNTQINDIIEMKKAKVRNERAYFLIDKDEQREFRFIKPPKVE